jgi:RNA polymerase sigma factor (sigma-70 family)
MRIAEDELCPGTDREVLAAYVNGSEEAFGELFRRHAGFVYGCALRQTGNEALAEEITQGVFVALARKAASLKGEVTLAGWLFRATRYAALDARKSEERRRKREEQSAFMEKINAPEESEAVWASLQSRIDDGLATLVTRDRQAILLRFFQGKSFAEVGAALGMNDNAARARVLRALERLRQHFTKQGIQLSVAGLAAALQFAPAAGAPVGIALSGGSVMAQVIIRRFLWRKLAEIASGIVIVGAILTVLLMAATWSRKAEADGVRAVVLEVDRAFSFADGPALFAQMYLRRGEEALGPALTNYARAAVGFNRVASSVLRKPQESMDAYGLTLEPLLEGQPTGTNLVVNGASGIAPWLPGRALAIVKVNGVWKWDCNAPATTDGWKGRSERLERKAERLDALTARVSARELTNSTAVLALLAATLK